MRFCVSLICSLLGWICYSKKSQGRIRFAHLRLIRPLSYRRDLILKQSGTLGGLVNLGVSKLAICNLRAEIICVYRFPSWNSSPTIIANLQFDHQINLHCAAWHLIVDCSTHRCSVCLRLPFEPISNWRLKSKSVNIDNFEINLLFYSDDLPRLAVANSAVVVLLNERLLELL